jgi:prepilin-type N-terminal cleavage/methylation domain-containing protein
MSQTRSREGGFTLLEVLVVLGIIGVMSAVAIPQVMNYLRQSRVRAAAQEVGAQITGARLRAVTKNANFGVLFVTQDANTYWVHMEDDQTVPRTGKQNLNIGTPDAAQSTRVRLPPNVQFATSAAQCPSLPSNVTPGGAGFPAIGTFNPAASSFRFNYLGTRCTPGTGGSCPAVTVAGGTQNLIMNDAVGNSTVCLWDPQTGLSRALTVASGGRVASQ